MPNAQANETRYVGARVPAPLADKFEALCASEYRSVSGELRRLIAERVAGGAVPAEDTP